jgi:hypothetical protein
MKILQHRSTGRRALENADHQNVVIVPILPKFHSQPYRIYRLENIEAIVQVRLQQTSQLAELITRGERSGLLTGIATMESGQLGRGAGVKRSVLIQPSAHSDQH